MNKYREREAITKEEFTKILEVGDEEAITRAMMDAVQAVDDPVWLLAKLKYQLHNRIELWVVGTSIVALTELALFHPQIDPNEVYSLIEPFCQKEDYRDWAEAALDELRNLEHRRAPLLQ